MSLDDGSVACYDPPEAVTWHVAADIGLEGQAVAESEPWGDVLNQAADVADAHYAELELEAARALIRDAFALLPWDLQGDYLEVRELQRAGKRHEANAAWDAWMEKARIKGLL